MDHWRVGYVEAPVAAVIESGGLAGFKPRWLPSPPGRHRFLADPFGIERDGLLHLFVERLDYRDRRGRIEVVTLDADRRIVDQRTCLEEPWHLSYPIVIEDGGETFMLPEAHRGCGLLLYRAVDFPARWERIAELDLPFVPVDATPLRHAGRWWLFASRAGNPTDELHLFEAECLQGPWRAHPASPIRTGNDGSRPGGTPVIVADRVLLPVQDNRDTYGGGLRMLTIDGIERDRPTLDLGPRLTPPQDTGGHDAGCHTLSACGPITLFDVKRIDRSLSGQLVGALGKVRRAAARSRLRSPRTGPR